MTTRKMKSIKKIITISLLLILTLSSNVWAEDHKNSYVVIDESELLSLLDNGVKICKDEIDFIKMSDGSLLDVNSLQCYNSLEEANDYIESLAIVSLPGIDYQQTNRDAVVATYQVGGSGYVQLHVSYTTSGDGNTGVITRQSAFTTFYGATFGFGWNEVNHYSYITSSGKDIYASASGEVIYYIIINNSYEVARRYITMEGYVNAIR